MMKFFKPDIEKMKKKKDALGLMKLLTDNDLEMRSSAVHALGEIGDARAIEPLIDILNNKDEGYKLREDAAYALGEIGDQRVVEPLLVACNDKDHPLKDAALKALVRIGRANAQSLVVNLARYATRQAAIDALARTGDSAVKPLLGALKDKSIDVQIAAMQALVKIGNAAVDGLITSLRGGNKDERIRAANALGQIKGKRAVESLVEALKDKEVRGSAVLALGQIKDTRTIEPLVSLFNDEDPNMRKAVAETLVFLNWQPNDNIQRAWLAFVTKQWHDLASLDTDALEPLMIMIKNLDKKTDQLGGPVKELRQEDADVLEASANVLGGIRDTRSVGLLAEVLNANYKSVVPFGESPSKYAEKERRIRQAAAQALWKLGAVEVLENTFSDTWNFGWSEARNILKLLGDTRAIKPLLRLARNKTVAEHAVEILLNVAKRTIVEISIEDLRAIHDLDEVIQERRTGSLDWDTPDYIDDKVDCSQLHQLARTELIRRGLAA